MPTIHDVLVKVGTLSLRPPYELARLAGGEGMSGVISEFWKNTAELPDVSRAVSDAGSRRLLCMGLFFEILRCALPSCQ